MTRLEYERRRRAWNQTELGYHARLSQSQVSLFERRVMLPSAWTLEKIARALGVKPEGLLATVSEAELASLREITANTQGRA